jgi:hypothetical protein
MVLSHAAVLGRLAVGLVWNHTKILAVSCNSTAECRTQVMNRHGMNKLMIVEGLE